MNKRIVSGIQPTGALHLGNYIGAIKRWVDISKQGNEMLLFIADLHAITMPQDPALLRESIVNTAAIYIASGLGDDCAIFAQSAVPAHSELGWILSCFTPIGWMNRMIQFKEKSTSFAKEKAPVGLYTYPILMAADILLYQADFVPVGEDQKQHIEITRDIAQAFNRKMGSEYFKVPEPMIEKTNARIMSLRDGTKKMSKSDESDHSRINLIDTPEMIEKKIQKAKTDSIATIYFDVENRPEISNLLSIYSFCEGTNVEGVVKRYDGKNSSAFKKDLAEVLINVLSPIQAEYKKLLSDKAHIMRVLENGRERASIIAEKNLTQIKKVVGFV